MSKDESPEQTEGTEVAPAPAQQASLAEFEASARSVAEHFVPSRAAYVEKSPIEIMNLPEDLDPFDKLLIMAVVDERVSLDRVQTALDIVGDKNAKEAERRYNDALAAAKLNFGRIESTGYHEHFRKAHETLSDIAAAVDAALAAQGLSYSFKEERRDGSLFIVCVLKHRDGHFTETGVCAGVPKAEGNVDETGKRNTRLSRYALKMALGIAASGETDGIGNDGRISEAEVGELQEWIARIGIDRKVFLQTFGIASVEHLPPAKLGAARERLNNYEYKKKEREEAAKIAKAAETKKAQSEREGREKPEPAGGTKKARSGKSNAQSDLLGGGE